MKKRNKHYLKEKEYISLQKKLADNWTAQRNLGYIELPEPIFLGYDAYLEPRDDIKNRQDAWVFEFICEYFSTTTFAKRIEYFDWNSKKVYRFPKYVYPHIHGINEQTYHLLPPQVQKWFSSEIPFYYGNGWGRWKSYYCTVPKFYFEVKYRKCYKTKEKIFDPILQQEEYELEYQIDKKFYHKQRSERYKAPKYFRKSLNRSQRAKSKQTLHNIVYKKMQCEFEDNYRGADWLWW